MKDKAGRDIMEGALVDVMIVGMVSAIVIKSVDSAIEIPGRPTKPPHLVLQVVMHEPSPDGVHVPGVHLIRNPREETSNNPGLIQP